MFVALGSLALIPFRITTIYSGLPAHPLFLHVPVILIPVAAIGALLVVARPRWISRHGVPLASLTVLALAGTILTVGAGSALRSALHLGAGAPAGAGALAAAGPAALIARHAHAASILRLLMIAFTAVMVLTLLSHRVAAGRPTGQRALDGMLARPRSLVALRALLGVLAIACAYFVFHTGDLGAKAVWSGRLNNRGGFGAPPGFRPGTAPTTGAGQTSSPGAP
jgi:hypothetical protein